MIDASQLSLESKKCEPDKVVRARRDRDFVAGQFEHPVLGGPSQEFMYEVLRSISENSACSENKEIVQALANSRFTRQFALAIDIERIGCIVFRV